jgi:hypothetical protein
MKNYTKLTTRQAVYSLSQPETIKQLTKSFPCLSIFNVL